MKYGYFEDTSREYVITQPDTPLPWINYLGCEAYFGLISNTAGGYSFYKDARLRRTPHCPNVPWGVQVRISTAEIRDASLNMTLYKVKKNFHME